MYRIYLKFRFRLRKNKMYRLKTSGEYWVGDIGGFSPPPESFNLSTTIITYNYRK